MRRSMEQPYLPRSSLPRCSRVIFTFSANSSCVIPLTEFLQTLSECFLIKIHVLSFPKRLSGKDFPFTVRSSRDRAESTAEAEEKAPSKSDRIKGYGNPVSNPASYGAWQSRSVTGSACSIKSRIVLFYFGCFHPLGSRYQRDSSFQIPSVIMAVPLCG